MINNLIGNTLTYKNNINTFGTRTLCRVLLSLKAFSIALNGQHYELFKSNRGDVIAKIKVHIRHHNSDITFVHFLSLH